MSVKKKDRHVSKQECLNKSRYLIDYILILVRPSEYNKDGKKIRKAGILGQGQPFQVFGLDLIKCGKALHSNCYKACQIYLKDKITLETRNKYHKQALEYCDYIFQQVDLCIFQYAQNNKSKMKSFKHLSRLTYDVKQSILDRMNRDKLIYEGNYIDKKTFRRGR